MVSTSVNNEPAEVKVMIFRLLCVFSGFKNSRIKTIHIAEAIKAIIPVGIISFPFLYLVNFTISFTIHYVFVDTVILCNKVT